MSLQGEGAPGCSFPFGGNMPDPRTNDAMAGLLTRRSSLLAAFPEISPVACRPQASGLQLRVQSRLFTGFPFGRPLDGTICMYCRDIGKPVSNRRSPDARDSRRPESCGILQGPGGQGRRGRGGMGGKRSAIVLIPVGSNGVGAGGTLNLDHDR